MALFAPWTNYILTKGYEMKKDIFLKGFLVLAFMSLLNCGNDNQETSTVKTDMPTVGETKQKTAENIMKFVNTELSGDNYLYRELSDGRRMTIGTTPTGYECQIMKYTGPQFSLSLFNDEYIEYDEDDVGYPGLNGLAKFQFNGDYPLYSVSKTKISNDELFVLVEQKSLSDFGSTSLYELTVKISHESDVDKIKSIKVRDGQIGLFWIRNFGSTIECILN